MKLVTFENAARQSRIGALLCETKTGEEKTGENKIVDLRAADSRIPDNMRDLFAGGDTALHAARQAFDSVAQFAAADSATASSAAVNSKTSPQGEPLIYSRS